MWRSAFAGAIALAMIGTMSVSRDGIGISPASAQDLTPGKIAQLKAVLKLTAAQQRLWYPVEAALRALVRAHASNEETEVGLVHRARARVTGLTLDVVAVHRLASVAQPLIDSLDEGQKRDGMTFVRSIGVASLF
jgi:zinc resistance-associated protein